MISKKRMRGRKKTSVTFRSANHEGAETVHVLGDFNGWDPARHGMKQRKDGTWSLTLRLPRDQDYQFRYLVDGREWDTDPESDEIQLNEFGGTNGVLRT